MPEGLIEECLSILDRIYSKPKKGRPATDPKSIFNGIFYVFKTGIQWKAVPDCFPSGSTLHRWFQFFVKNNFFYYLWEELLMNYDEEVSVQFKWQSIDSASIKSPLGGEGTGKNPTDRGKLGTKLSIIVDGNGVPLSLVIKGANVHDVNFVKENIEERLICDESDKIFQNYLCGDKGYDSEDLREQISNNELNPNIKSRGVEKREIKKNPNKKARRWVVERTFSWLKKFRKVFTRWEKKVSNFKGVVQFACAWICWKNL